MAKFGHGRISPFFLGAASTLALCAIPLAALSLASEKTTSREIPLAVWALVMSCGLLIPLAADVMARRRRRGDVETESTAGLIVGGTCVVALLTWLPVVSGFPWRALHGMTAVAFGMAMYVGVFAAAATPTVMTGSYRVNERSITLGVALGVFLVYRSLGTLG